MKRRDFSYRMALATTMLPFSSFQSFSLDKPFSELIYPEPVLTNIPTLIDRPIIIDKIEIVRILQKHLLVICTSTDGEKGFLPANSRMPYLFQIMEGLVIPHFLGKDARNIEVLIESVYRAGRNYKFAGMPFWNCVGHVEGSILDMLGNIARKPVSAFMGEAIRESVKVYYSTFDRVNPAEVYVENVLRSLEEAPYEAVKLKVGGRMSNNQDCLPGRTEQLVPLARKRLGDNMHLLVDANGSYDAKRGIEVGKLLQDHGYDFFEEPCPWQDYVQTQQVADALKMQVAGGEQDNSLPQFNEMIHRRIVDLIQPDMLYSGGFIRVAYIAKMAEAVGMSITPHNPRSGPAAAQMLHLAAVTPNMGPYQEYDPNPDFPDDAYAPILQIENGNVDIPQSPGWGFVYNQELIQKAEVVMSISKNN